MHKKALAITPHINNGGVFRISIACNPLLLSCPLTMKQHAIHHYSYAGTVIANEKNCKNKTHIPCYINGYNSCNGQL